MTSDIDDASSDSCDQVRHKTKINKNVMNDLSGYSSSDDNDDSDFNQSSEDSRDISSEKSSSISSDSTESSDDSYITVPKWVKGQLDVDLPDFNGEFRLATNVNVPQSPLPIDIFSLFFTPEIANYIVDQSNLYRTQQNIKVEPMNKSDLYQLIGFLFYSSSVKLPCKGDYWSAQSIQPAVSNNITRNRIYDLLRILHFNDNSLANEKCGKIQPLIDLFNERCRLLVEQEQFISIDEQMVGYKGRAAPSSLKQYIPTKPSKYGFKLWSKSGVSGYVYKVDLYQGSKKAAKSGKTSSTTTFRRRTRLDDMKALENSTAKKRQDDLKSLGASGMVVMDMLENVPPGSKIFVNNYFGSVGLIKRMTELSFGIVCTLRQNRTGGCPLPSEYYMKNQDRGFHDYRLTNDRKCIIVAWKDSKRVLMGSNYVGIDPIVKCLRWNKGEKKKMEVTTPQMIHVYNQFIGGVDTTDMLCALHAIPFRSKKWYIRLVWRIFDRMALNSWLLWRNIIGNDGNWRRTRLFQFKIDLARSLLQTHFSSSRSIMPSLAIVDDSDESADEHKVSIALRPRKSNRETKSTVPTASRYDSYDHWPEFKPGKYPVRCKNSGCKQRTQWMCSKCRVHLCIKGKPNCFFFFSSEELMQFC